ncbi:DUF1627 domain-containing protein [Enterobacter kobei]|uniref:DUF1627 domain-containing protein n=1 Tax=Enterobacter kobei TaxID=208224 RepID=UPI003BD81DBA
MKTVIQVLEKMGRATYREVAARLDVEPIEALNMLREQREQGLCDFSDGGWFIGSAKDAQRVACVPQPKPALHGEAPRPVDPAVIRSLLAKNGTMDTPSLATAVNRNARGMTSVMHALERQGVVVKNGKGKGVTWFLAAVTEPVKQEPVPEATAAPEEAKPVEQIVSEIPSFTEGRAAVEAVPAVRDISREIRRTRNKLEQLTKLRDAVRVIGRHRNLVQQLTGRE